MIFHRSWSSNLFILKEVWEFYVEKRHKYLGLEAWKKPLYSLFHFAMEVRNSTSVIMISDEWS